MYQNILSPFEIFLQVNFVKDEVRGDINSYEDRHIHEKLRNGAFLVTKDVSIFQFAHDLCIFKLVVRAQDIDNLVLIEFLHAIAGGAEVLARVKLGRLFGKGLADGGGHGQAAVAVDVDLADGTLGGLTQLLLGDADGSLQCTTIFINGVHLVLRHRR